MRRFLIVLTAALCWSSVVAAQVPGDPISWLGRISNAAHKLNYTGSFTYQSGKNIETSRIAHLVDGGAGCDVLSGGYGRDVFVFNGGQDTIIDFETGNGGCGCGSGNPAELIQVDIDGVDSYAQLIAAANEVDGNTVFDLGQGNSLVLEGVALASLDSSMFAFI